MTLEMSFLALLLGLLAATVSATSPSTDGFISIDCGAGDVSSYTDAETGLVYSSDGSYISSGVDMVSSDTNLKGIRAYYATVRSFRGGVRHCYTLRPVLPGTKYRVNAEFLYGNYDGLIRSPTFDLYLGVNLWKTVETGDFSRSEIITIAQTDRIQVCLVNTGGGTPFISALELRPLPFSMYRAVDDSSRSFVVEDRLNYGGEDQIKFPDDKYDRTWFPQTQGNNISTTQNVNLQGGDEFSVPPAVLQTAAMATSLSESLNITTDGSDEQVTFAYIYFAELRQLASNETREFDIYAGQELLQGAFRPSFHQEVVVPLRLPGGSTFDLRATTNSTLPPIINAVEIFTLLELSLLPTDERDVEAILDLKTLNRVSRNWEGDPCVPRSFMWQGLECGYEASNYSTITSLDLSHSNLSGGIPSSIANLTSLKSLDLSYNDLTGEIPAYLGELSALESLNLEGNNLNGTIPKTIHERSQNRSLTLRISNNPILCSTTDQCDAKNKNKNKNKVIVPLAVAASASVLLLVAVAVAVYTVKRKRNSRAQSSSPGISLMLVSSCTIDSLNTMQNMKVTRDLVITDRGLPSESHQFSISDITLITKNFERIIGKGGFGTVYHGNLGDGTDVAVKVLSRSSAHGEKQFRAEAQVLARVHHKYLVSLLGFCKENMALVYEFVPQGSLADHLSGDPADRVFLSWSMRLRIALEAATGLDYLHNGCKPPIVHRDVKSSNILLTNGFEVKLADFGLSRFFSGEEINHVSTEVAGTPGYLDPEYYQTSRLTAKSDVYSFGIVLLELITGRKPISNGVNRNHVIQEVQSRVERGDIAEIADQRMQGRYSVNSMWRVIEIGLSCTTPNSGDRPNMSDVAAQLKECLAIESSGEFSSYGGTSPFAIYHDNSIARTLPSGR